MQAGDNSPSSGGLCCQTAGAGAEEGARGLESAADYSGVRCGEVEGGGAVAGEGLGDGVDGVGVEAPSKGAKSSRRTLARGLLFRLVLEKVDMGQSVHWWVRS
nr:unnamed protein product [Digitaria exilis]